MSGKTNRIEVPEADINLAVIRLQKKLAFRLNQKGNGTLASRHEILGVIMEEVHELQHAVEDKEAPIADIQDELLDIAVACVFGDACILNNTIDW